MGRLIQTISVPPGSGAYYAIEDMKRLGKNVSQVICDIVARHHELYDEVSNLRKVNRDLRQVLAWNRDAIDFAGLYTVQLRDDFGNGPCIGLRLRSKESGFNAHHTDIEKGEEE